MAAARATTAAVFMMLVGREEMMRGLVGKMNCEGLGRMEC
jgi:hypothetical protein